VSGVIAPRILDFDTIWKWLVSFTPRPFYPRVRTPCSHCTEGWVGSRVGLDEVAKRRNPIIAPAWTEPRSSSPL